MSCAAEPALTHSPAVAVTTSSMAAPEQTGSEAVQGRTSSSVAPGTTDSTEAPGTTGSERTTGTTFCEAAPAVTRLRAVQAPIDWKPVSPAFFTGFVIALLPLALAAAASLIVSAPAAIAGLAAIAFGILLRFLSWRWTAYRFDEDRLLIRTRWWRRRLVVLPIDRIQTIDINESFVSRWFGIATLRFGVAGAGLLGHWIPAVRAVEARQLRASLLSSPA